jgi:hypothetical protein
VGEGNQDKDVELGAPRQPIICSEKHEIHYYDIYRRGITEDI